MADLPAYARKHNISTIFISQPISAQPRIRKLLDDLQDTTASIYFLPDIYVFDLIQARFDNVAGVPVVAICETPFTGINSAVKRISDVVLASIILLMLLPVMLVIAIAIKLTSPGPAIFKQRRYGLDGEEIIVYKFRSMTVAEDGAKVTQATRDDKRVTKIGAFLRRSSLDELPQFFNVLQGRMSIVGPRPHAVAHNELYRKQIKGYMLRHKVRPGITGWAQVNGFRGETETLDKMEARISYDLDYLRRWSLALDLWIIMRTIKVALKRDNAY
jgi:putative colanic acid biosynthesis UDP-glucose lipid carrier transferase